MRLGKARPEGVEISGPVYRLGLHFNGTYTARHEIGRIVRRKYDDGTGSNRYAYYQVNRKRQAKRRGVVAKVFGDCLRLRDRLTVKLVRTKGAKLSPGAKLAKRRADRAERAGRNAMTSPRLLVAGSNRGSMLVSLAKIPPSWLVCMTRSEGTTPS